MSKIGSHDTMTYLKPKKWWMRPFHFVAKCQNKSIEEQYNEFGIRLFDIRVRYNEKENIWEFAHGCMTFKGKTPKEIFDWLNSKEEKIYIRLILEYNRKVKNIDKISDLFVEQAKLWIDEYKNLAFFEMTRKYDWKRLYNYNEMPYPSMYQATSSTTWKIWDDWFPWFYAHRYNKDNYKQGTSSEYLLMDFIGMW